MDFLFALIAISLVIIILVGVHELGHLFFARLFGIRVERFSIGFGKVIFRRTDRHGTEFAISLIPLGGYVKMLDEREGELAEEDKPYAFNRQAIWKRFLVILAGPMTNLLCALLGFWLIFMIGVTRAYPIVDTVVPNTPAATAGIKSGDDIISIDGVKVEDWVAIAIRIIYRIGDDGTMTVVTKKTGIKTHSLDLSQWQQDPIRPEPIRYLGMLPTLSPPEAIKQFTRQYGPWRAMIAAFDEAMLYAKLNTIIFYKVLVGKISTQSLGGPFTLFFTATMAFDQGLLRFLEFLAIVSVIVATVNVFPYPGLDGGHLLYLAIEKIRGKPMSTQLELLLFRLGIIGMCVLLVHVMVYDLVRYL